MNNQWSAGSPETKTIGDHLLALHAAWESSDKIRRALHKQTRNACNLFFNGDVYYNRTQIPNGGDQRKLSVKMAQLCGSCTKINSFDVHNMLQILTLFVLVWNDKDKHY